MSNTDLLSDLDIVARTLDGEAGNQGANGITAVGCIIQKRTQLQWQNEKTARDICLHLWQFSCWLAGPDRDRIMAPDYIVPPLCEIVAETVLKGLLADIVNNADSYIVSGTPCYWAEGLSPVAVIGAHSFYITRKLV